MARLQPGAVHRRQRDGRLQLLQVLAEPHRHVQEAVGELGTQESLCCLLQRAMVGNVRELNGRCQLRRVLQELLDAPIVAVQELLEYQAGEQLRLRVRLGTELMRVVRQRQLANQIADQQNLLGRFTRSRHTY